MKLLVRSASVETFRATMINNEFITKKFISKIPRYDAIIKVRELIIEIE